MPTQLVLITGASGTEEFGKQFNDWKQEWEKLATRRGWNLVPIDDEKGERSAKQQILSELASVKEQQDCWLVFLGHGTARKNQHFLNLRGEDLSVIELNEALAKLTGISVIIDCSATSGAGLQTLAKNASCVITATRSSSEINFAVFGKHLATSINSAAADLDHDAEISLLEAFLHASRKTAQEYEQNGLLMTEHALLDDNRDGKGTSADFYRGVEPVSGKSQETPIDGAVARSIPVNALHKETKLTPQQLAARRAIETQIQQLRTRKDGLSREAYFSELETLLLELASVIGIQDPPPSQDQSTK